MSAGGGSDVPDVTAEDVTLDAEPPAQETKRRTRKQSSASDS